MIRQLALSILSSSLFIAAGPAPAAGGASAPPPLKVVTSFYPMFIMAMNVTSGAPGVELSNLTPSVTGCLHDYSLTTADMKKLSGASVFIVNGAGMENFLKKVAAQYPKLKLIEASKGIELIKESGHDHDGDGGNPHVWVSISNAIAEVKNIAEGLAAADPSRAALYRKNAGDYIKKLEELRVWAQKETAPLKGAKIVTFHEAFPYFAKEFGLVTAAVIEREPGSEPSAKEMADIIKTIRGSGVKAVFAEPQYPAKSAGIVAKESGAKFFTLDPAVTGPDTPGAYIDIMRKNIQTLKEALK
jgi:zinc transport system substrate-binding protein